MATGSRKVRRSPKATGSRKATASSKLALAKRHLRRALAAWPEPTDWDDLSLYGFYCVEAAVEAAALHLGLKTSTRHWEKVDVASKLHVQAKLPDATDLLRDLNDARKSAAYGDTEMPEVEAEEIATQMENYVDAVTLLLSKGKRP